MARRNYQWEKRQKELERKKKKDKKRQRRQEKKHSDSDAPLESPGTETESAPDAVVAPDAEQTPVD